jgi:hypothetical protein
MSVGNKRSRGGNERWREFKRSVRQDAKALIPSISATAKIAGDAKYFECFDQIEKFNHDKDQLEIHFVKDKSITAQQMLRVLPQTVTESIMLKGKQLDKTTGKLVTVTETRVLKMSDKTLLQRGKPTSALPVLKRSTSRSKRITVDIDADLRTAPRESKIEYVPLEDVLNGPVGRENVSKKGIKLT